MKQWYEIKAQAEEKRAELWIYEEIGENFWGEGVTAKQFVKDLTALDVETIDLHINSPGGNVFDGLAIFNALRAHPATVNSYIDGLAASIATVVALAGEHVSMAANALFVIHKSFGIMMGDSDEAHDFGSLLEDIDATLTATYSAKTGMSQDAALAMLKPETRMTAPRARDLGFVDEITGSMAIAASVDERFDRWRAQTSTTLQHLWSTLDIHTDTTDGPAEDPTAASAAEATAQDRDRVLVPGVCFKDFLKRKA